MLYQTLYDLSYREVLEIASHESFSVPALSVYHYRVKKLDEGPLQKLVEKSGKVLFQKNLEEWESLMTDGTGFGFGQKDVLHWLRGTEVRQVQFHVRLVALIAVDAKRRAIVLSCTADGPYSS